MGIVGKPVDDKCTVRVAIDDGEIDEFGVVRVFFMANLNPCICHVALKTAFAASACQHNKS